MSKSEKIRKRRKVSLWLSSREDRQTVLENISLLLDSGMDMMQALLSVQKEVKSKQLAVVLKEVADEVESGVSLSEALKDRRIANYHEIALLAVGEDSGRLVKKISFAKRHDVPNLCGSRRFYCGYWSCLVCFTNASRSIF